MSNVMLVRTVTTALGAIVDEEALGGRVWKGPWIPVSAFAGYGTGTGPHISWS